MAVELSQIIEGISGAELARVDEAHEDISHVSAIRGVPSTYGPRNFREMFGITPSEFKAKLKELFRFFQEKKPNVVFLQDTLVEAD